MADLTCHHEDCDKHPRDGHAVYRVSPKGQPGVFACEEHMKGPIDPIVKQIVDAIQGKT